MSSDKISWKTLQAHRTETENYHMRDNFDDTGGPKPDFVIKMDGLKIDYSRHRINPQTLSLLIALAQESKLEIWRDKMFKGAKINHTEDRAVLHTALRAPEYQETLVDGQNIMPGIHKVLEKMRLFSEKVRDGSWTGYSGKAIKTVVNLGIGGSDLGPRMAVKALDNFKDNSLTIRFVSNIDPEDLKSVFKEADPETTLFIVASKSFTTQETMFNAENAKSWIKDCFNDDKAIEKHFVALSTNERAVTAFGINKDNMFTFEDWVGGRFSLWSAIGLSICISIGFERFKELLAGAHAMDTHFQSAPLSQNMPVILALIGLWYRNFWDAQSYAVLPYSQNLALLPEWLQQVDMESNGKTIDRDGKAVTYQTGPVIFGQAGTNGQHAFYQLLHQGTSLIPCDFIAPLEPHDVSHNQHKILLANMIAQSQALMQGQSLEQAENDTHRVFEGNRPSTLILIDRLTPYHLGLLLSLYEHKVFCQGVFWNINSFDQWGVELGKNLTKSLLDSDDEFIKF
jgi:glucose-6-phosphate isomerase